MKGFLDRLKDELLKFLFRMFRLEKVLARRRRKLVELYRVDNELIGSCDILLIGDSHTYALRRYTTKSNIVNRGLNGETTSGILDRWELNFSNIQSSTVVVQIGYNDFKFRKVDEIFINYEVLVRRLKFKQLILVSLFPVLKHRVVTNRKIIAFNLKIYELSKQITHCKYVDVFSNLYDTNLGGLYPELTYDGIHLVPEGNKLFLKKINEIVDLQF